MNVPRRYWLLVAASAIAVLFALSSPRTSSCVSARNYDNQACLAEERRSPASAPASAPSSAGRRTRGGRDNDEG